MTTITLLILLLIAALITLGVMAVSWWQDERAAQQGWSVYQGGEA